jgi:hypothetical protein
MIVYLLFHEYQLGYEDESKLIGVYSRVIKANNVIDIYKLKPGFCMYPNNFIIDEYELDENNWESGFVTIERPSKKNRKDKI